MLQNLLIELFSENNQILTVARKALLAEIAGIPDPCLAHEMEPRLVHNRRHRAVGVGSEEDGGAKDSLEGSDQAAILRAALLHSEGVQHFGGGGKRDPARPLAGSQGRQEEWNQAVLAPRKAVVGVTSDEQNKLTFSAFVDQGPSWRTLDRQAAEDKGTRGETEILTCRLPAHSDAFDHLRFPEPAVPNLRC